MSSLPKDFPKFSDVLSIQSNPEDLFTLISPIGIGSFGKVYKACHNETLKLFAIKIIDYTKDGLINKKNISINYNLIQEETALMRLVQNNDNILKYYGSYFSRKTNSIWLILEYCSCGSLQDIMYAMEQSFTEIQIATLIKMVLKGLICLHDLNIIHRDIKAQNILLTENGCAKLADFGVGIKLMEKEFRHSKKGSPYWMSPQIVSQKDYDIKTDIWSLGITCIELALGNPPFSDLKPIAVMNKIKNGSTKVEDMINVKEYSKIFIDFIKKCIVVDPNKRASARELIQHEFIKKKAQEKEYIEDFITQNNIEIKQYMDEKRKEIENIEKIKEININNNNQEINKKESNKEKEESEKEEEINNKITGNNNEEIYSYITEKDNIENESEKNNLTNNIENYIGQEEDNNSMIVKDDKQLEEISTIIEETKKYINDIDIDSNKDDDEEMDYEQKKLKEMEEILKEKIAKKKKKKEEEEKNKNILENKDNMKTPIKKEKKENYEKNHSMNTDDINNIDMQSLLLNENDKIKDNQKNKYNKSNNNNILKKRSEVTTGFTGSKTDSSDGKKFLSNNLIKLENKILYSENNNNIYTKKKIDFIDHDLSNIENDSEDEQINPIKQILNVNFEDNKFEKCYTERKKLKTAVKQNRINFLEGIKINKYINDFDINTKDDILEQNIHLSAIKKHKKYFN